MKNAKHFAKIAKNGVKICEKMRKKCEIFVARFVQKVVIFEAILAICLSDFFFEKKAVKKYVKKEALVGFVVDLFGFWILRDEWQDEWQNPLIKSLAFCSNLKTILHILISYDFWRDDDYHFALLFYGFFVRKQIFYQRNRA